MSTLKKAGFFSAFILPILLVGGYYLGGAWNYSTLFFVFVLIPVFDYRIGIDRENVDTADEPVVSAEAYYRLVCYSWVYLQLALVAWAMYVVSLQQLSAFGYAGFLMGTMTITGGIGITVAHELGHKKSSLERFYSQLLLMTVSYMHFYIEHNKGHHVHVATPLDPATSRRGETFYTFWWRTVSKGYLNAWHIENSRLRRQGRTPFSIYNAMIWYLLLPVLFCLLLTTAFSMMRGEWLWELPVFFFAQSLLAFTLLEAVNYIEHYGIERKLVAPGRYERVNPLHSWNASHLLSNFFLFQLQRHSDHHAYAIRPYQVLRHIDESPQLPFGYPTMLLMALVPPLWFRVMDHRLEAWKEMTYGVDVEVKEVNN